jgi:hypothetical protein
MASGKWCGILTEVPRLRPMRARVLGVGERSPGLAYVNGRSEDERQTEEGTENMNKLPTQEEIAARFKEREPRDFLGFETSEYLPYMTFEDVKPYLKPEVTKESWEEGCPKALTQVGVHREMLDYMEFAWEKANDQRGISANRSVLHYIAWTWLYGDREFSAKIEKEYSENYQHYGKEILVMICERFGWDHKQWDDGVRSNG